MPCILVDTSFANSVVGATTADSVSQPAEPPKRWYCWTDDALPEGWPGLGAVGKYTYDGNRFVPEADDVAYQILEHKRQRDAMFHRDYDGNSPLSGVCERLIVHAYGSNTTDHETHTRQLYGKHANPVVRTVTDAGDKERNRLARRYHELKNAVLALNMNRTADRERWDWFAENLEDRGDPPIDLWAGDSLPLPEGWPSYQVPDSVKAKWSAATSPSDVDEAAERELISYFGSLAGVILASFDGTADARVRLVQRRRAALKLSLPDDPRDTNHWGHDIRIAFDAVDSEGTKVEPTVIDPNKYQFPFGTTVTVTTVDPAATITPLDGIPTDEFTRSIYITRAEDGTTQWIYVVQILKA